MEEETKNELETWIVSIILTIFGYMIRNHIAKTWKNLPTNRKEKFRKGCIKDFKIACILTVIVFIFLIAMKKFP